MEDSVMAAKANYSKKPENKKKVTEKKEVVFDAEKVKKLFL